MADASWQPPPAAAETYDPAPKGRFRRGLWLTRKSWALLSGRRELWTLPVISAVTVALAAVLIFVPITLLVAKDRHHQQVATIIAFAIASLPLTFLSTYFNVAFLGMVEGHIEGREMSIRDGLRFAGARKGAILGWAVIATIVGLIIRLLENIRGGQLLTGLIGWLGGMAWSLATFFVVPVLVLDDVGPIEAVKRSAGTLKRKWGEQITGDIAIGAAFMIVTIPAVIVLMAGFALTPRHPAIGIIVVAVGVAVLVAASVASSAMSRVFSLVLYRHAEGRAIPEPFTEQDVARAFKPKRRRFGFGR